MPQRAIAPNPIAFTAAMTSAEWRQAVQLLQDLSNESWCCWIGYVIPVAMFKIWHVGHTFATLWYSLRSFRDLLFSVFNLTWSFSDPQSETQWSNSDSQLGLAGDAVAVQANLSGDLWRCSKCCCTRWPMANHFSALGWDAKLTGWGKREDAGKQTTKSVDIHSFDAVYVISLTVSLVLFHSFQASQIWRMDWSLNYQHLLVPLVDEDVFASTATLTLLTEMKWRWRFVWILLQCLRHVLQEDPIPRLMLEITQLSWKFIKCFHKVMRLYEGSGTFLWLYTKHFARH